MSHSVYIPTDVSLDYHDVINELGVEHLRVLEENLIGSDVQTWPAGYLHFYVDNVSCRPIEVGYENSVFEVRILSSSHVDEYALWLNFATTIARMGNAMLGPEDGDEMDCEQFRQAYGKEWAENHCKTMLEMTVGMYRQGMKRQTLSAIGRDFVIGPRFMEPLLKDPDTFAENFYERFRRFNYIERENVFFSDKISFTNKEETKVLTAVTFSENVPTLLNADADIVSLGGEDGKKCVITSEIFIGIVQDGAIWLSEDYLLIDAVSGKQWAEYFSLAKKHEIADTFEHARDITAEEREQMKQAEITSYRNLFGEEEWSRLIYAPFIVFILISMVDGKISKKEGAAFAKTLGSSDNPLLCEILETATRPPQEIVQDLFSDPEGIVDRLREIVGIVDARLPQIAALQFKVSLFGIGKEVAKSSGGFFGFGKKIGKKQQVILETISSILIPQPDSNTDPG